MAATIVTLYLQFHKWVIEKFFSICMYRVFHNTTPNYFIALDMFSEDEENVHFQLDIFPLDLLPSLRLGCSS